MGIFANILEKLNLKKKDEAEVAKPTTTIPKTTSTTIPKTTAAPSPVKKESRPVAGKYDQPLGAVSKPRPAQIGRAHV